MKKVTYYASHEFRDNAGNRHTMNSQLYQTGVYVIFNDDPSLQRCASPMEIRKLQNKLQKQAKAGEISDLEFGLEITALNNNGFWEEVPIDITLPKFQITIKENETYTCNRSVDGVLYRLTVTKINYNADQAKDSTVEFFAKPVCHKLPHFLIGENLFRAGIGIFQNSVVIPN